MHKNTHSLIVGNARPTCMGLHKSKQLCEKIDIKELLQEMMKNLFVLVSEESVGEALPPMAYSCQFM